MRPDVGVKSSQFFPKNEKCSNYNLNFDSVFKKAISGYWFTYIPKTLGKNLIVMGTACGKADRALASKTRIPICIIKHVYTVKFFRKYNKQRKRGWPRMTNLNIELIIKFYCMY